MNDFLADILLSDYTSVFGADNKGVKKVV